MSKLFASAYGGDRHAPPGVTAAEHPPTPDARALDPEWLELVQRFEQSYAELAPIAEEPQRAAARSDELFPEFPEFPEFRDVFAEAAPPRPAPAESARVLPMPRREPEAHKPEAQTAFSAAPAHAPKTTLEGGDIDLDEAMAILRAAENRHRLASGPGVNDNEESVAPGPLAGRAATRPVGESSLRSAVGAAAPARDWTTRSHTARTIATAAAAAALGVGVAAGYFLGRSPASAPPKAVIQSSQNGGTQLKLERDLLKR
jgi:hypothetical protein